MTSLMQLPAYDDLIEEQLDVLEHPLDEPLFVAGPPGSGKTVLALKRAQMLDEQRRTVELVTFNRMLRRLATLLSKNQLIAKTMHSFVGSDYNSRTRKLLDSHDHDWRAMLAELEGHPNSGPNLDHLVIDEGQDLPEGFFRYAARHAAKTLTVFADENQALADRRTTLKQIKHAANLPHPKLLSENHRNTPEIAALATHFHSGQLPAATVRRTSKIKTFPRLVRMASITETAQFIQTWFKNRNTSVGVVVHRNNIGARIHDELRALLPGRRVDLYTHGRQNENSIELLEPGITILNKESVKGQEFETVFILELERFIPCITDAMRRVMYMLCTRARDNLFLLYGPRALSAEALAALPGEHLLERS